MATNPVISCKQLLAYCWLIDYNIRVCLICSHHSLFNMTEKTQPADHENKNLKTTESEELLLSLPKERGWISLHQYQYQGFWVEKPEIVTAIVSFQKHFQARDSDIVLASVPKSGTTWLKALTFAIVNRHRFAIETHPLLTSNPHALVPFLELDLYTNNQLPDLSKFPEPRLLGTHVPFPSLGTIVVSNCKIIYICRNPFDTFVSAWHYFNKIRVKYQFAPLSREEAFDMFCKGRVGSGPFWDHMLGYWNESLKRPQNVLFLKYEAVKEDVVLHMKRLAKFLDYPFTEEEERNGLIEVIAKLCSFETMTNLEVNKTGKVDTKENKLFFRKAEVGDWANYFTPEMENRLSRLIEEKLGGSGLTFKGIPKLAHQQN